MDMFLPFDFNNFQQEPISSIRLNHSISTAYGIKNTLYLGTTTGYIISLNLLSASIHFQSKVGTNAVSSISSLGPSSLLVSTVSGELIGLSRKNAKVIFVEKSIFFYLFKAFIYP